MRNTHLTDADLDMWAASEARYKPAADPAEAADTRSGMRMLGYVAVFVFVPLVTGVIALVRYLVH